MTGTSPGARNDTHDVLPPKCTVSSPWQGVEPRTP
jgi:hypothetical protein